jgi:protein-L-isoaspartate O-methyltransferase
VTYLSDPPNESQLSLAAGSRAVALFVVTAFAAACLLFTVQPMFAKMILPRLGGSPSVWNTCMLFFQTTLLLGYIYGHVTTRWLGLRRQTLVHLVVVLSAFTVLPLSVGAPDPSAAESPVLWLLRTMTVTVGIPFFVVSTTAPLLQRWFAVFPIASARDPYFLYAASNLGSMVALLGYPFILEPLIGVRAQTTMWAGGYAMLCGLIAACVWLLRTVPKQREAFEERPVAIRPLRRWERLHWVLLSFVPSSLMLGVTTYMSTDIAPVPLLWVVPLALYLLTFVLAFSPRETLPAALLATVVPPLIIASLWSILVNAWWSVPMHLATFFCSSLVCHRQLSVKRPDVAHLTEYYVWISVGGTLGGVFNSLVAPHLFATILEYPLVLAIASLLNAPPRKAEPSQPPMLLVAVSAVVVLSFGVWASGVAPDRIGRMFLVAAIGLATPLVLARWAAPLRIIAFALVGLIAFATLRRTPAGDAALFVRRSFFGVHRVVESADHTYRTLQHGSTMHGWQQLPSDGRCDPSSYYAPAGPIGQLLRVVGPRLDKVAVIGLGTGALACYAERGQRWTFFEIDPIVAYIARNPAYFTHLSNSQGDVDIVLGDGRITLGAATQGPYDVIILDAFSSDAIPLHLLTREAFQMYLRQLHTAGIIAVHISNRYLNLEPVLAALAQQEHLVTIANRDSRIPQEDVKLGRRAAHWVLFARSAAALAPLSEQPGWRSPDVDPHIHAWTDDHSNILSTLAFN